MTRYDPYSYGQVRLGGDKAPSAPPQDPSDLLFADPPPKAASKPKSDDTSWELLDADVTSLLPNAPSQPSGVDFGTEVLGEPDDGAAPPVTVQRPRPAAANVRPAPAEGGSRPTGPVTAPARREVGARASGSSAVSPVAAVAPPEAPPPRSAAPRASASALPAARPRPGSLAVPTLLFAGGGTGSAWLFAMQQDPVLAGITGALTVVATAFAWVLLRR